MTENPNIAPAWAATEYEKRSMDCAFWLLARELLRQSEFDNVKRRLKRQRDKASAEIKQD